MRTRCHGIISAGDFGWSGAAAVVEMLCGGLALGAFVLWERRVETPLVDLRLFSSRAFTWGASLSSLVSFVMFGLLFAVPLYFQVVRGADAQASGIRLLPLIGGMFVGSMVADRLAARAGARAVAALGLVLLAAGFVFGATTTIGTGDGQSATWIALSGIGLGLALPTSIDTAMGSISDDSSGVSSAVLQALRMVGGALGAAILGALINAAYRDQLDQAASPAFARSAHESAVAGVDAASAAHSPHLLDTVREAFVGGMNLTLWVSAALMAAAAVLAVVLRPGSRDAGAGSAEASKSLAVS
jgi:DHA2 family multidrug resistance protein-like MFS transporter